MNPAHLINNIKKHPDYHRAGMILCHNGVVRSTSRDGRKVSGLTISVDNEKLEQVVASNKQTPGIVEILVEFNANRNLSVGDDVMLLVVAGDIRETVIRVLTDTLNAIKTTVTHKTEFFEEYRQHGI
ncbi:MAG: molybdenum cofactor biosynthesis protein MoaE [Desulfobacterales bacterium]|uniref:Molybdopterin synthase catalytic subunit n=1 Tax=Candidatus Desulfatibia vada TaxID=2841696 RepID=A0A8J6P2M7_9BACT|nr:molybdenum cofactor biosynthesis protein MoaE [Candidatus Desulfatibia vada]